ncbi:flagellin N-terminal helical domain-containing protein [Arthrobacter koreensis]|uniref:flagellin N-terminal helical domain-containing protein n=1 Tax=Arthrobacter koreensis TaxID=199136 RepID=UPI002DBB62C6|nr:flagellin [Arthrobacter koreensis]MEB7447849.1 flagellin [Arthrobacter koreensis]
MGFTIATNVSSLNAMRNLNLNQTNQAKSVERLSSGLRINRAADDAAGLSISEGLKNQISGLQVAGRNAQDGISVIQTAEGALTEVHNILNRMRDLAVQGGNESNNPNSTAALKKEADALGMELNRIATGTKFNDIALMTGGTMNIQVGAGDGDSDSIALTFTNMTTALGGLMGEDGSADFDVTDNGAAKTTITALDTAITAISSSRSDLGAQQNRLESTARSIAVSVENLSAANSRIRDTDMAAEMGNFTKSQILSQAATAMLAQANQMNSGVMQLLQ